MVIKDLASSSIIYLAVTILLLFINSTCVESYSNNNSNLDMSCSEFNCGNLTFRFPFSSSLTFGLGPQDCGLPGYQIYCETEQYSSLAGIMLSGRPYQVKDLYLSERLITVVDTQLIKDLKSGSCSSLRNLSVVQSGEYINPLSLPSWTVNLTLFRCPSKVQLSQEILEKVVSNYSCSEGNVIYLWQNGSRFDPLRISPLLTPNGCDLIRVPASTASFLNMSWNGNKSKFPLLDVLDTGFPLTWPDFEECNSCNASGGRCGFDGSFRRIVCFDETERSKKKWKKEGLAIGVAIGSSFTFLAIVLVAFRRPISLSLKNNRSTEDVRQFIKTYQSSLLTNYSYNDIKKMSNGFREKLGEGGYGSVYKGKLQEGHFVAIKLLENSNNSNCDFVNEVATIGRIHHFNIIRLLGFSYGSKQALIYEYMPNGSLANLLSNEKVSLSLGLTTMLEIAVGIARGIEYLHNGCESRILHLDIKPQNVLLDKNFNPKISDFGLAKIYSRSKSVIKMTHAGGTIGYIAPEIFMRNLGNPSHKSDVYSYGMLLLEMIGGKKLNTISNSSETYFPDYIYAKLIAGKEVELEDSIIEEDTFTSRKMVMVGVWCIQINPKDRPSMTRVVEMLSGNVGEIEIPPKPHFLISPPYIDQHEIDGPPTDEKDTCDLPVNSDSHELQESERYIGISSKGGKSGFSDTYLH